MSIQSVFVVVAAVLPFAAVAGLLWLAGVVRDKRAAGIARQIALTDAIHRELGAAAAPVVRWSWPRGWIVSVQLPLHREGTVGAVTRITHDVFRRLDRDDPPRLRLVLLPQQDRPWEGAGSGLPRPAVRLRRAA
jgi:hypothetical protein